MPLFLSTPSARRATSPACTRAVVYANFYPRPPRGGRHSDPEGQHVHYAISIHALREEGDRCEDRGRAGVHISIHALREEGDGHLYPSATSDAVFLSTPSARRATPCTSKPFPVHQHFYPRPPRGGRQIEFLHDTPSVRFLSTPSARRATVWLRQTQSMGDISIHALREEGDCSFPVQHLQTDISIHALREEGDHDSCEKYAAWRISIHALREEGDCAFCPFSVLPDGFLSTPSARRATAGDHQRGRAARYFYPRPPRGGRRKPTKRTTSNRRFLSTPSARRATIPMARVTPILPRFLSTPSARRATKEEVKRTSLLQISIHALREEGDVPMVAARKGPGSISIHALREEGDYPKQERRG